MFLRRPNSYLNEENNNFAGGKHFLKGCENSLRLGEDFRNVREYLLAASEAFLSDAEMFLRGSEMFLNDSEMFLNRPSL